MTSDLEPVPLAVVGAGLAGATAAAQWRATGRAVTLFDKGRGPGGRMSTRRSGPFDHGAQYFTAKSARFRAEVARWAAAGVAARWPLRLGVHDEAGTRAKPDERARYVGTPGMSAVLAHLTDGLDTRFATRISRLTRDQGQFCLHSEAGVVARSPRLLVALPAPQAAALLEPLAPVLAARAAAVRMQACWAALVCFEAPTPLALDGIFANAGPLSWAARDSSKPGREAGERWVLHAGPGWTQAHLEDPPETVIRHLLEAFAALVGAPLPALGGAQAHRWRYALAPEPLDVGALTDPNVPGLAVAGDWCAGSRVEGAFDSGHAAAAALLEAPV